MSKVFKKFPNKILVHMKTFNKTYIRVLDHLLGREKHLSVFFPNSLYLNIVSKTVAKTFSHPEAKCKQNAGLSDSPVKVAICNK